MEQSNPEGMEEVGQLNLALNKKLSSLLWWKRIMMPFWWNCVNDWSNGWVYVSVEQRWGASSKNSSSRPKKNFARQ